MSKPKVYIDGQEGTTGLQIHQRLAGREDIELLLIDPDKRKDLTERKKLINAADLVFLCLPDAAAVEAVGLIENSHTRVIDASTAHRTAPGWVYGFPELLQGAGADHWDSAVCGQSRLPRHRLSGRRRPPGGPGSAAQGLPPDLLLPHRLLRRREEDDRPVRGRDKGNELYSPSIYGTTLKHKHLPEMQKISGLDAPPVFCPVVDDYYKGMATTIQLHNRSLRGQPTARELCLILAAYYAGQPLVSVAPYSERARLSGGQRPGGHRPAGAHRQRPRGADHRHRPVRQPGQGRLRRGGAEHEPDAGL